MIREMYYEESAVPVMRERKKSSIRALHRGDRLFRALRLLFLLRAHEYRESPRDEELEPSTAWSAA